MQKKDEEVYLENLEIELATISELGYSNYFVFLRNNVVVPARKEGYFIGGRGSVIGCLVAYLSEITEIDPIVHELSFSRFLNKSRVSPPDIDLDFSSAGREYIIKKLSESFSVKKVANIVRFSGIKSTMLFLGRVLNDPHLPYDVISAITTHEQYSGEINESAWLYKLRRHITPEEYESYISMKDHVPLLLNRVYSTSKHAGAVIISPKEQHDALPCVSMVGNDGKREEVIAFNGATLEKMGYIKYDFLVIKAVELIERLREKTGDAIYSDVITRDSAYIPFEKGFLEGIFQFSGASKNKLKSLLLKITRAGKIIDFNILLTLNALNRGDTAKQLTEYVDAVVCDKKTEGYLENFPETKNFIVYQEQIMKMCVDLGEFSPEEADNIRRSISKKDGGLGLYKKKFIEAAVKNKEYRMSKKEVGRLWTTIENAGRYCFNKSHAVAYTTISLLTGYYKVNYRDIFYSTLLDVTLEKGGDNIQEVNDIIAELKKLNFTLKEPQEIAPRCVVEEERVIILSSLIYKGVGPKSKHKLNPVKKQGNRDNLKVNL